MIQTILFFGLVVTTIVSLIIKILYNMKKFFKQLFCKHKYKLIYLNTCNHRLGHSKKIEYHYRCIKCRKHKVHKVCP